MSDHRTPRPAFRFPWRSRRQIRSDFEEELAFHSDMRLTELLARGMSADEAHRAIAAEAGDLDDARRYVATTDHAVEATERRRYAMQHLGQELVFAVRRLRRDHSFTLLAVSTLGLGLGACVLIFNIVASVLLAPLPFANADRIYMIWQYIPSLDVGIRQQPLGGRQLSLIRDDVRPLESVAGFRARSLNLRDQSRVQRLNGIEATGQFFDALGVQPELGRFFSSADELPQTGGRPVVLSDALWREAFGADPAVIGRVISLSDQPYVVSGVAPPGFAFPRGAEMPATFEFPARADAWIPIAPPRGGPEDLAIVARLRAGATASELRSQLARVRDEMLRIYPQGKGFFGSEAVALRTQLVGKSQRLLLSLLAAVSLLLLIACVNAAQLQLARLQRRRRELAVHAALGAPAWRLVVGGCVETLAVAFAAGAIGTAIAILGLDVLRVRLVGMFPLLSNASFDARSALVATATTIVVGLAAGLGPGLLGMPKSLAIALRAGGRGFAGEGGALRARRGLIVAELTLSVVLVVLAGLLGRSLSRQLNSELGFSAPNGLTFELTLPPGKYPERQGPTYMEHPAGAAFISAVLERLRALPGVDAAAMGKPLPLSGSQEWSVFSAEGIPQPPSGALRGADFTVASGDMFRALGTRMISGRDFNSTEVETSLPVVIVNQSMARWLWRGTEAVGKRIKLGGLSTPAPWMTVIGVSQDLKRYALTDTTRPEMIVPYAQKPYPSFSTLQFVIRSGLPPSSLLPAIRRAVAQVDPAIPVSAVRTMDDLIATSSASARFATGVMTAFGAAALFLASIGLYGVVAYGVQQRRQEFGVRRALGVSAAQVAALVAREVTMLMVIGIALGAATAVAAGFAIRSLLYGVTAFDAPTLSVTVVVIAAAGFVASAVPVWRATRVAPRTALDDS